MKFITKGKLVHNNTAYFANPYRKLATCPFCGIGTDAPIVGYSNHDFATSGHFVVVSARCTACSSAFISLYEIKGATPTQMDFLACYPKIAETALHEGLASMSPRFAELHHQAEAAAIDGLIDIAIMGYRAALEVLVKDYAITELGKPEAEVSQKKLAAAIAEYLNEQSLISTADVVRLIGNDYAHYKQSIDGGSLEIVQRYYKIFLDLIAVHYDINHPPVSRGSAQR